LDKLGSSHPENCCFRWCATPLLKTILNRFSSAECYIPRILNCKSLDKLGAHTQKLSFLVVRYPSPQNDTKSFFVGRVLHPEGIKL